MSDAEFKSKTGMTREQYLDLIEPQTCLPRAVLATKLEELTRHFGIMVFIRASENIHG